MKKSKFTKMKVIKSYNKIIYLPFIILWISVPFGFQILEENTFISSAKNNSESENLSTSDFTTNGNSTLPLGAENDANYDDQERSKISGSIAGFKFDLFPFIVLFLVVFSIISIFIANTRPLGMNEFILQSDLNFKKQLDEAEEEKLVLDFEMGKFQLGWSSTTGLPRFWKMNLTFEISKDLYDLNEDKIKELIDVLFLKFMKDDSKSILLYSKEFRIKSWPKLEILLKYWINSFSEAN